MQIDYSRNRGTEDSLGAAIEAAGEIRMRIQPQLFSVSGAGKKLYLGWKGVYWNMTCTTAEEAVQLRDVLAVFFRQMEEHGVEAMHGWLQKLDRLQMQAVASPARDEQGEQDEHDDDGLSETV